MFKINNKDAKSAIPTVINSKFGLGSQKNKVKAITLQDASLRTGSSSALIINSAQISEKTLSSLTSGFSWIEIKSRRERYV